MDNLTANSTRCLDKSSADKSKYLDRDKYLELLSRSKYDAEKMLGVVSDLADSGLFQIDRFPRVDSGYSRTILYRESSGFEVMAARWSKGAKTPIHGHPGFTLVYLIEGLLWEDSFETKSGILVPTGSRRYRKDDYSFDQGIEGRFDNSIHRITAVDESLSLHIYSDDALKGEIFST